jgi:hypothetical protein
MGALLIVVFAPSLTALLLLRNGPSWRASRFGFEHTMHLLVGCVVLWVSAAAKLYPDIQTRPPDAQLRQTQSSVPTKRRSIVYADNFGQAIMLKATLHGLAHWGFALIGQQLNVQNVTAEEIAYRQRFGSIPILRVEPALEIHRPNLIRRFGPSQGW